MIAPSQFQDYLQNICHRYEQWWAVDALTETIAAKQATFSFEQMVQTEENKQEEKPQTVSLPILKGIQNYIESEHILLVGSPGVGKSTALLRCLVSFAKKELEKPEPRIPVLVPLKRYNIRFSTSEDPSGMLTLIRDALKLQLRLKIPEVEEVLFQKRLILLLDGLNEMPADTARTQLKAFREECQYSEIPLICTTRELGSGDLGIKRRLEVQPLSPPEINRFLQECMPAQAEQILQLLSRDNRELSRTPFVLWMLYQLFQEKDTVVETLGEAFRQFFRYSKKYKEDAPVTDERRRDWNRWLEHLAFTMLNNPEPNDPGLIISDERAEKVITDRFGERYGTSSRIEELLKYHLLERVSDREISFNHQLIQEYYAAEYLLEYVPDLLRDEEGVKKLKCHYLNSLKWTEPIAIMLGLPEITETQAIKIIELALDVDLMLGARLAGEVKPICQPQTVDLIAGLNTPPLLKAECLGITRSEFAITKLLELLKYETPNIREKAAESLGKIGNETAIHALLETLDDEPDFTVRWATVTGLGKIGSKAGIYGLEKTLEDKAYFVRLAAIDALVSIGGEEVISTLLKAIKQRDWDVRLKAAYELEKLGHEAGVALLSNAINESNFSICSKAISALALLKSDRAFLALLRAVKHQNHSIHIQAIEALGRTRNDKAINILLEVFKNNYRETQEKVIEALGQIGSKSAIREILKISQYNNSLIRIKAIEILVELGNASVIPVLLSALKDEDFTVRGSAALALGKIGNETAVPDLLNALAETDGYVCENAAISLGLIGGEAAIPDLQQTLQHPNFSIRVSAARALGLIGNTKAIPALIKALENSDCKTLEYLDCYDSLEIAIALSRLGSEVGTSALIKTLEHPFPSSMFFIWDKLEVEAAIPVLMKALEHQESYIYTGAASALDRILRKSETFSKTLIPILHISLENQDACVRTQAITVLEKIDSEEVIQILLPILIHENIEAVRFHAARVLARLGREEAISILAQALNEGDPLTTSDAAYNLAALGTESAFLGLLNPLENENFKYRAIVVESLEKVGNYKALPKLFHLRIKLATDDIRDAIAAIQSRCGFYNYEIAQYSTPELNVTDKIENECIKTVNMTYHFDQRGATIGVNVTSEGSNIKFIQHAKQNINISEQDLAEAAQKIQALLNQLAQTYPPTSEPQQQKTFIQKFLERLESTPDLIKFILAGGIEGLKVLWPPAGIPVEMARSLYEVVQKRYGQP